MAHRAISDRPLNGPIGRANAALATMIAAVLIGACGASRRSEPLIGEKRIPTERIALGEQVFSRICSQCHPAGEGGLAPALNNKPLPAWAIRFQVRQGLGAMPSFSKRDISDEQLKAVAEYVVWLRRQGS